MGSSPISGTNFGMKKIKKTNINKIIKSYLPLAILLVLFCVICVPTMLRSLWFDEAYSSNLVRGSFTQITEMTAIDVHPPLYYWCLKIWTIIFGRSIMGMRALSVVFAVLTLIVAYILFKRWAKNDKTALLLTALLAACPFFIYYSGEMRMYTMSCFIVLFGTLMLDVALEKNKKIIWFLYSLSIAAALYTHYFTALGFAAHFVYLIFHFKKHGFNKNIIWVYLLAIIAYIPWIPTLLHQVVDVEGGFWPNPVTPLTIIKFFSFSFVYFEGIEYNAIHLIVTIIAIVALLIATIKGLENMGENTREKTLIVALITFLPPAVLMAISMVSQSVYVERYITYSLALVWVLYGILMLSVKNSHNILYYFLVLVITICFCFGIKNVYKLISQPDPFAEITAYINESDKEKSPIVYYDTDAGAIHSSIYETDLHPVYSYDIDERWGAIIPLIEYDRNYIHDFEKFKEETNTFWYIVSNKWSRRLIHMKIGDDFEAETEYNVEEFTAIRYVKKQK